MKLYWKLHKSKERVQVEIKDTKSKIPSKIGMVGE
jgi:hypothetical protein